MRGSARGCWGALVILRELPDRGSEWFPSNVARNSHACILGFEIRSLELQRLWPISKNDRIKLRATFGGVVTSVTFGPLCQAPPLHRPRPFTGPAPSLAPPLHWPPLHRLCSSAPPGMQQRRDPAGSRLNAAVAKLPTRLARRLRAADQGLRAAGQRLNQRAPATAADASGANAQFFHQPLTVSTAWVPRSVSAEWALTRPEDRRAAWKREATFSQFTRFHQALT